MRGQFTTSARALTIDKMCSINDNMRIISAVVLIRMRNEFFSLFVRNGGSFLSTSRH